MIHYWRYSKLINQNTINKIIKEIHYILKDNEDIELEDIIVNNQLITFNGDSDYDLDYDPFYINFNETSKLTVCNTNDNPYDLIVCLCLLILADNITEFEYYQDNKNKNWIKAFEIYDRLKIKLN
jgi:hypothetical protein